MTKKAKRKKPYNATKAAMEKLKAMGYVAEVVERWIPRTAIRKDFFGCIDIIAVQPEAIGCLGIQVTTSSNHAGRVKKAKAEPKLGAWLEADNAFEVWSTDRPARGKQATWRIEEIDLLTLHTEEP